MATVLFTIMPTLGHFNATIGLARDIRNSGNRVVYCGGYSDYLDSIIVLQGFDFVKCNSIPFGLRYSDELNFLKKRGGQKKDLILRRVLGIDFEERKLDLISIVEQVEPSFLIIDSFIGCDLICMYELIRRKGIKVCFINTMCYFFSKKLPPLDSDLLPDKRYKIKVSHYKRMSVAKIKYLYEWVYLLGRTTKRIIRKNILTESLSLYPELEDNMPIGISFTSIPHVIMSIPEFDFVRNPDSNKFYVGSYLCEDRAEVMDRNYKDQLESVLQDINDTIFISLGSLANWNKGKVLSFFHKMMKVARLSPDRSFLFSSVPEKLIESVREIPTNVHLFSCLLPQMYVLSKVKLFICHGGMNSIRESISQRVPMLFFPINSKFDQISNASKAQYHGIGKRIYPNENVENICRHINSALDNKDIALKLDKFRKKMEEKSYDVLDLCVEL